MKGYDILYLFLPNNQNQLKIKIIGGETKKKNFERGEIHAHLFL